MATILIVDDRPTNRQLLVTLLGYGGHRLLEASDGAEALAKVRAAPVDLIITDLLMPTMDGYEFTQRLRADPGLASILVIFYTATYRTPEARRLAEACGVQEVLAKPSEPQEILEAVHRALNVPAAFSPPPLPTASQEVAYLKKTSDTFSSYMAEVQASNQQLAQLLEHGVELAGERDHLIQLASRLAATLPKLQKDSLRLTALMELGFDLLSERDPPRLCQMLCDAARRIVNSRYSVVVLLKEDERTLNHFFCSGLDETRIGPPPLDQGVLSRLLQERQPIRLRALAPAELGLPPEHSPSSFLGLPIATPLQVYGLLYFVDSSGTTGFGEEEEWIALTLAAEAAVLYENAHLYDHLQRHSANLQVEATQRRKAEEDARQSERRIDAIANALPDLLFVLDEEGRYLEVLTGQENLLYADIQKLKGRLLHEILPQEAADLFLGVVHRTLSTGQSQVIEYPLEVQEGRRHFEGRTAPLPEVPGEKRAVVWVSRDLTQRKEAEKQLALFRTLIDHTDDSIEVIDPETGRFLDVSENACLAHGYTREEYLALTVPEIDPLVAGQRWKEARDEVRRAGSLVLESQHRRKDGSLFPVEVSIAYIRLDRDYLLAVVRDITQRKRQEAQQQALQKVRMEVWRMRNTDDFGAVLIQVRDGLQALDVPFEECGINVIDRANPPPAVRSHNLTREGQWTTEDSAEGKETILQIWRSGMPAYRRDLHREDIYGERQPLERAFRLPVRSVLDVPFSHGTLTINSTQPDAFSAGDIVFLENLAEVLSEGFRRLDDLQALETTEAQFRQAQKLEAIGQLAGGVAHDFNNLLTVVSGYSELLLRRRSADHPDHAHLQEIQQAADRGTGLVRQLLAFSRKQVLKPRVLDLNTVVRDLEKMMGRLIGEDVELVAKRSPGLGRVKADPGQLEQVLVNLVVNARDAMPRGGRLTIETRNAELDQAYANSHAVVAPGAYVLLEVSDTGVGMDAATQARIFEPFFTTKEPGKGTGLGLATVYGIVKQSGGYIWVYSEPGQGTSFKIYLPRLTEEAQPVVREEVVQTALGSETLLLVEDEAPLRQLAALILREQGYTVLEASRGEEALSLSVQHQEAIHAVVSDMVMPGMSGPELVEQLLALRPELKVLYISGYSEDIIAHRVALKPGTTLLQKPFKAQALLLKVRQTLDS